MYDSRWNKQNLDFYYFYQNSERYNQVYNFMSRKLYKVVFLQTNICMFRDDEDEDNDDGVIVDQQNSQLNKFLSSKTPGGGKKGTKGTVCPIYIPRTYTADRSSIYQERLLLL